MNKHIIEVTRNAVGLNGTSAGIRTGDKFTFYELCFGVMLPSGNDAAFMMSEHLGIELKYRQI